MPRRNLLVPLLAIGMAALFGFILVRLLLLRYERGDVYPAYSTLRSDPLGARAFYEALDSTGRYKVERGFATLHRELETKPNSVFYLGLSATEISFFTKTEIAALDDYVKKGGRVLITFAPEAPYSKESDEEKKTEKKKSDAREKDSKPGDKDSAAKPADDKKPDTINADEPATQQEKYEREELRKEYDEEKKNGDTTEDTPPEYQRSLAALWGFGWMRHAEATGKKKGKTDTDDTDHDSDQSTLPEVLAQRMIPGGVEPNVPWKSALYFVRLEPDWAILYRAKDQPVMIRRHWGNGEIVIATDSYFISNEALRNDRRPLLLNLLAGWPGGILFDEAHLGTEQKEGVMSLAEKFHLEGFLYGIISVLALVLWRNSSPLVPPQMIDVHQPLGRTVSGKDSRSGLVNLLRRNIPPSEILKVCLAEWKRGVIPSRVHLQARLSRMESIVTATTDHPERIVQSYHDLSQINASGKMKETHATRS